MLDAFNLLRFSRQLPILGEQGQEQLSQAKVLVIGAGGLGCPVLLYLTTSGLGHLGIVDGDRVEISNLPRQILFEEADLNLNKAQVSAAHLQKLNSACQLLVYPVFLNKDNAQLIIEDYDIVVDATDNYAARYLINSVCRELAIPLVSASIFQFQAQISVFNYQNGPCYECLYPAPPPANLIPNCAEGGILGIAAGVAGTLQATEVLKIILNKGEILSGKLMTVDLLSQQNCCYPITKKSTCSPKQCSTYQHNQEPATKVATITAQDLAAALKAQPQDYCLLDVRQAFEREICNLGGEFIPLADLEQNLQQLPRDKILVTYCKAGVRGEQAAALLLNNNFSQVFNLQGGILAWIDQIDCQLRRY